MPLEKRKRDSCEVGVSVTKRRKIIMGYHSNTDKSVVKPFVSARIPSPAQPCFPFFRLPAELRAQVLDHAYGQDTIYVTLKSDNRAAEVCDKYLEYSIIRKPTYPHPRIACSLPPRVSKHFYTEATTAFYTSSTFSFDAPHAFRAFALSEHACVPRIQHLTVQQLTHRWTDALVSSLVGRLASLRGVHLTHYHNAFVVARPYPHSWDASWEDVWRMIRAFQQHELEAQRTRFDFVAMRVGCVGYESLLKLQKDFTDGLLNFKPRRLTRSNTRCGQT